MILTPCLRGYNFRRQDLRQGEGNIKMDCSTAPCETNIQRDYVCALLCIRLVLAVAKPREIMYSEVTAEWRGITLN